MVKAAPITGYREYRAESDAEFPFYKAHKGRKSGTMQGPSGSTWKIPQLNWLGMDYQFGCDSKEIAPADRRLAPAITEYLRERLNMTWQELVDAKKKDLNGFYIDLRTLLSVNPELKIYDKSSTYNGSSQPREIHTPSPSATLPDKPCSPLEVQNMPSPYNKGHIDYMSDHSSIIQTAELSPSLKPNISSPSSSASHLNYICEPPSPTHSSGLKPSNSRTTIMTTPTRSQMTETKRPHSSEPDQYRTPRHQELIRSDLTDPNISRREASDDFESCSSSSLDSEPDLESGSVLLSKQSLPLSAEAHSSPTQSSSAILDRFSDPLANASQHNVDLLPPLSARSDSSLEDEETQIASLPLETISAEERKKAKIDTKDKDEKMVEVLAGSFMNIISMALDKDEEMKSEIG